MSPCRKSANSWPHVLTAGLWLWKWGVLISRISAPIFFPVFSYPFLDRFLHLLHADFNGEQLYRILLKQIGHNHLNLVCYSRPWPWLVISEITEKKWLKIFLKPTDLTRPHRRQTEAAATKSPTQHPRRRPVSHPFFFAEKKINRCS